MHMGLQYFNIELAELDDANEAEEDLPAERGGAGAGKRERKEEKRSRGERGRKKGR